MSGRCSSKRKWERAANRIAALKSVKETAPVRAGVRRDRPTCAPIRAQIFILGKIGNNVGHVSAQVPKLDADGRSLFEWVKTGTCGN